MRFAFALLLGWTVVACSGGPVTCAPDEVPNDALQACVKPVQCDGGVVNERNECVVMPPQDGSAGAAADAGSGRRSFPQREADAGAPDAGSIVTGDAAGAGAAGTEASAAGSGGSGGSTGSSPSSNDAGAERDAGPMSMPAGPACGNGVREAAELCDGDCPTQCPAAVGCEIYELRGAAASCSAECVKSTITAAVAGDSCCPAGANVSTDNDCQVACGDGVISSGETCDTGIPGSCPTASACERMGNGCMRGRVSGSGCGARCEMETITERRNNDRCCPAGATASNDNDCEAECGNGVREGAELCDGADCPTSCDDDGEACSRSEIEGSAAACNAQCVRTPITEPNGIVDGCCPSGGTPNNDGDCPLILTTTSTTLYKTCGVASDCDGDTYCTRGLTPADAPAASVGVCVQRCQGGVSQVVGTDGLGYEGFCFSGQFFWPACDTSADCPATLPVCRERNSGASTNFCYQE